MLSPSLHRATIRRAPPCVARSPPARLQRLQSRLQTSHVTQQRSSHPLVHASPEGDFQASPDLSATSVQDVSLEGQQDLRLRRKSLVEEVLWNVKGQRMGAASYAFNQIPAEELNEGLFAHMVKGYLRQKNHQECWNYYQKMLDLGFKPTVPMYSLMLKCCAVSGDRETAIKLWQEIKDNDEMQEDRILYNTYIHVFSKANEIERSLALLEEMKEKDIAPDIVTYNTLLAGISRLPQVKFNVYKDKVDDLVEDVHISGEELDVLTFHSLAKLSLRRGDGSKALRYMDEVIDRDVTITEKDCQLFVRCFALTKAKVDVQKVLERCWKLFLHCERRNGPSSYSLMESMVMLFVSYERWSNAFAVFSLMEARNQRVTREMYDLVLKGLAAIRHMSKEVVVTTQILMDEIEKMEFTMTPEMYTSTIQIFLKSRALKDARFYLQKMKKEGITPPTSIYNFFLAYYSDNRYVRDWQAASEEALELWNEIRSSKVTPTSATFATLATILANADNVMQLERLLAEMKVRSIIIQPAAYVPILHMYARGVDAAGGLDAAMSLFEDMKREGVSVNTLTYDAMIEVCVTATDLNSGLKLLTEMKEQNISADSSTYRPLMKLAGDVGNLSLTFDLFNEMLTAGIPANSACYSVLIQACGKAKAIHKVLEVLEDLKKRNMRMNVTLFCDSVTAAADCSRPDLIYRFYDEFLQLKRPLSHEACVLLSEALERSGDAEGAAAILELEKEQDRIQQNTQKVAQ